MIKNSEYIVGRRGLDFVTRRVFTNLERRSALFGTIKLSYALEPPFPHIATLTTAPPRQRGVESLNKVTSRTITQSKFAA
jgi:hypothetical protein